MKLCKIVGLTLAILMILATVGFNAYAGVSISDVSIVGLAEPVVGWEPDYVWKVADSSGFKAVTPGAGAIWYESEDGYNFKKLSANYDKPENRPVFKEGYCYRFVTEFQANDDSSWDYMALDASVNGVPADFSIKGKIMTLSKTYGPLTSDGLLTVITIQNVVPPSAGAGPNYKFSFGGNSHVHSSLAGAACRWEESTDGGLTWNPLNSGSGDKFKAGCTYRFYTEVEADKGYTLSGNATATVNGSVAGCSSKQVGNDQKKVCAVAYAFPPLGEEALRIKPAGGEESFYTYSAGKDLYPEVVVENAGSEIEIQWFYCDSMGNKLNEKPFGSGYAAIIKGIPSEEMMVEKFVLVIARETGGSKRTASAVIPYMLYPMGSEESPVTVTLLQGGEVIISEAGKTTTVNVVLENNESECSVDWFPCDSDGNTDRAHPFAHGYNVELPAISDKDAGVKFYYEVYAEDDRGPVFGGNFIFVYTLQLPEPETPTPTPTPTPTSVPTSDPTPTPTPGSAETAPAPGTDTSEPTDSADKTAAPGETAENASTQKPDDSDNDPPAGDDNGPDVLLIVLIAAAALSVFGLCVMIGYFIGKKNRW